MRYIFFIAFKHLFGRRKTIFGYITTAISIGGIFIGVAALIIVLSVMNGFQTDVKERIIDVNAHVVLLKYFNEPFTAEEAEDAVDTLLNMDGILSASPFIYSKGLIKNGNYADAVIVRGYDINDSTEKAIMTRHLKFGRLPENPDEVLLGIDLAEEIRAHTGDTLLVATPFGSTETVAAMLMPKMTDFVVSGLFDAGMYQYNSELIYIPLETASRIFGMEGGVSGVEMRIRDIYKAPQISERIEAKLGYPFRTNNWIELNGSLFAALALEKKLMFLLLLLVIIVAAFNIITTLIMIVMEKTTEIGVLKTLGLTDVSVMKVFLVQGFLINLIGTVTGIAAGLVACYFLGKYQFINIPGNVYLLDKLPVQVNPVDILLVIGVSLLLSLLATLYPALTASRMNPVEAIRYE